MDHEHDDVPVLSADETQAREYCRDCGRRTDWRPATKTETGQWTEDELNEIKAAAGRAN